MANRVSWKGRYMVANINSKTPLTEKRVIAAMRQLRRENGCECLFSIETIHMATLGDKSDLQSILEELAKFGQVYGHGGAYRLS